MRVRKSQESYLKTENQVCSLYLNKVTLSQMFMSKRSIFVLYTQAQNYGINGISEKILTVLQQYCFLRHQIHVNWFKGKNTEAFFPLSVIKCIFPLYFMKILYNLKIYKLERNCLIVKLCLFAYKFLKKL